MSVQSRLPPRLEWRGMLLAFFTGLGAAANFIFIVIASEQPPGPLAFLASFGFTNFFVSITLVPLLLISGLGLGWLARLRWRLYRLTPHLPLALISSLHLHSILRVPRVP